MDSLIGHLAELTQRVESFRMPIVLLVAAIYGYRIVWKVMMAPDTKGIWEDIITLTVAISALVILPQVVKSLVEALG